MSSAAIVLAGGRSTRMGAAKAALAWHGSTLAYRAAGLATRTVDGPVIVVAAAGQELPALPAHCEVARDARDARGPLEGIAAGLRLLAGRADVVFACGVDAPLLHPAFIRHILAALSARDDVALPRAHGFAHPLAAAYRVATVAPLLAEQLAADELGTRRLLARCRVRELDEPALLADAEIARRDPALHSLLNVNDRAAYAAAHALPRPAITVQRGDEAPHPARGAMLAHVADGPATVDGIATDDPQTPLAEGDVVRPQAA